MTELNELKYEKLELAPAREAPRTKNKDNIRKQIDKEQCNLPQPWRLQNKEQRKHKKTNWQRKMQPTPAMEAPRTKNKENIRKHIGKEQCNLPQPWRLPEQRTGKT